MGRAGHHAAGRPADRHLPPLDGLRGVAVLLVMAYHFAGSISVLGLPMVDRLPFRLGWAGVDVFFVLSGFLITSILLDSKGRPAFFRNFYARRILRICPLYYGGILVVGLLRGVMGGDAAWGATDGLFAPGSLFWPMTYLENLALGLHGPAQTGILSHYWSLAVEEHFYLFWPLIVWACSTRQVAVAAGLAVAGAVLLRAYALHAGGDPAALMGLTPLRLDGLALGALASVAARGGAPTRPAVQTARAILVIAVAALFGIVVGRRTLSQFDPWMWVFGYTLIATATSALILMVRAPGRLGSALSHRGLRWFGTYSFGLYVWHPILAVVLLHSRWAVIAPGQGAAAILLATGTVIAATLGVAWLSYHAFEKPFLALKRFFPSGAAPALPKGHAGQPRDWQPAPVVP